VMLVRGGGAYGKTATPHPFSGPSCSEQSCFIPLSVSR